MPALFARNLVRKRRDSLGPGYEGQLLVMLLVLLGACGGDDESPMLGGVGAAGSFAPPTTPTPMNRGAAAGSSAQVSWSRYSSNALALELSYPSRWVQSFGDSGPRFVTPGLDQNGRTRGAELFVITRESGETAQQAWSRTRAGLTSQFPHVRFEQPMALRLGGQDALQIPFTDPKDGAGTRGWFVFVSHGRRSFWFTMQAMPASSWTSYESTFRALLGTVAFL